MDVHGDRLAEVFGPKVPQTGLTVWGGEPACTRAPGSPKNSDTSQGRDTWLNGVLTPSGVTILKQKITLGHVLRGTWFTVKPNTDS